MAEMDADAPEWLAFVNRESRDRIYRLRVMTEPRDVKTFMVHRLASRFDFPLTSEVACAVADCGRDGARDWLDLVPLSMDPDGYEILGPIRVTAGADHVDLQPGSVIVADLVIGEPTRAGLAGRLLDAEPFVSVTR